jgi:hypothetical protein
VVGGWREEWAGNGVSLFSPLPNGQHVVGRQGRGIGKDNDNMESLKRHPFFWCVRSWRTSQRILASSCGKVKPSTTTFQSFWNPDQILVKSSEGYELPPAGMRSLVPATIILDKLEVSLTRNVQKILRISMYQVKKERIIKDQVRKRFYNIPCVKNMIAAQLSCMISSPTSTHKTNADHMLQQQEKPGRPYTTN